MDNDRRYENKSYDTLSRVLIAQIAKKALKK